MLKKVKLKNSTIFFIGFVLIVSGLFAGSLEYLKSKKNKAFSEMNILLYENEIPEVIESEESSQENDNIIISDEQKNPEKKEPSQPVYNYIGTIEIPKINVKRGFLNINSAYNNVNYNVTVINGSTFPDEKNNNLILAAHSGPCSYCYFDKLYKLNFGDIAVINYKGVNYKYKIVDIYDVEKTGKVAIYRNYNKSTLTLITCTRNSNTKQTVYILELI